MPSFKFGKIKGFHMQRQVTDTFTIDINKVVLSNKVSCNNGMNWRYIIGYQVDRVTIIPLFMKTSKNIFIYCVSQYDKNSAYAMLFNVPKVPEWVLQYRNIWNEVELQLFEMLITEPIKGEGR